MIRIENLTRTYGPTLAVDDISLEVKTGEVLGFLGPNGAGKTTTMRVITCFMLPTKGNVYVDDLNVYDHSMEIRRKIGYLPENAPVYLDMNVMDYLEYVSDLREVPKNRKKERMSEMVDVCGLKTVLGKDIGELSRGFRQRVGLAQAMIHDPEILVLDEPTLGLDPNQIAEIRNLIKKLGKEKTVILSTHILPEVQATCDRVVIIDEGKIVADGTTDDLRRSYMGAAKVTVELKAAPENAVDLFNALPGVESVSDTASTATGNHLIDIETKPGVDIREDVFNLAVQNKWTILEMHTVETELEDIFRHLTTT